MESDLRERAQAGDTIAARALASALSGEGRGHEARWLLAAFPEDRELRASILADAPRWMGASAPPMRSEPRVRWVRKLPERRPDYGRERQPFCDVRASPLGIVASTESDTFVLDPDDGSIQCQGTSPGEVFRDRLIVLPDRRERGGGTFRVEGRDLLTGEEAFRASVRGGPPLLSYSGELIFSGFEDTLHGYRVGAASSLEHVFSFAPPGRGSGVFMNPVAAGQAVLVWARGDGQEGELISFDPSTGAVIDRRTTRVESRLSLLHGDRHGAVAADDDRLLVYGPDGVVWREVDLPSERYNLFVNVVSEHVIVVSDYGPERDYHQRRTVLLDRHIGELGPPLGYVGHIRWVARDVLYAITDQDLVALTHDGTVLWRAERGEEIPRGTIHEGSLDTIILADTFPGRLYYPLGARAVVCLEDASDAP